MSLFDYFQASKSRVDDYVSEYRHDEDEYVFIDALDGVFAIGGIKHPNDNCGEYYRLDASKKHLYSNANRYLASNTSGAQVRVATDAAKVRVRVTLHGAGNCMHHFTDRGVYGCDFYIGEGFDRTYVGNIMMTFANSKDFNDEVITLGNGVKEFTVNLPLYEGVKKVEIGFPKGAYISKPLARQGGTVAFYGSSVTQGGCAGRPGNMYSHILCRQTDSDNMNLGFSGSARGEQAVAMYLASRDNVSAFVMDYDFNATSNEELEYTHYPFYQTVRNGHPDMPIIFVTHPYYTTATERDRKRCGIVFDTYGKALQNGDRKVWFVDSESFFPAEMRDLFAVDILHPNDLGNYYMAKAIYPALKEALFGNK